MQTTQLSQVLAIAEQFVRGKSADQNLCEDIIHVSDKFVAIIDGSSIKGRTFGNKSSGRFVAEVIDRALYEVPANSTLVEGTKIVNQKIREAIGYRDSQEVMKAGRRPAASCMFFSRQREEMWTYGDTLLMVDGITHDLSKEIDRVVASARCAFVRAELLSGKSTEELVSSTADHNFIEPILSKQQESFLNNAAAGKLGYGNLDGADEVLHFARTISVKGATSVIMASDGFTTLFPTLEETEAELARIIKEDPLMINLCPQVKGVRPGNESFDDRAYVRLERKAC
jgi:hypothetical protein